MTAEDKQWTVYAHARGGAALYLCKLCKHTTYSDDGTIPKRCEFCEGKEKKQQ